MEEKKEEEMYEDERWVPVIGYEGWYGVSDWGRVRRMKAEQGATVGKILVPMTCRGYKQVSLYKYGVAGRFRVHQLVMDAFVGPLQSGMQVNHIDGDKANNRLDNLEYVTPSENQRHAFRIGLQSNQGENHSCSKLTEKIVHEIRSLDGKETRKSMAERFGVHKSTIKAVINRRSWGWLKEEGEE